MATIRAYRAEIQAAPAKIRAYRAELTASPSSSGRIRVYRGELTAGGGASLGADLTGVEPWSTVTLTATAPGTPTSWTFTQVSGPAVTLVPAGNTVSFTAPAALTTQTVTISAVANYAGGTTSGPGTVNVEVLYATEFLNTTTAGWVPVRWQTFDPAV